jgi:hypothetical protein
MKITRKGDVMLITGGVGFSLQSCHRVKEGGEQRRCEDELVGGLSSACMHA